MIGVAEQVLWEDPRRAPANRLLFTRSAIHLHDRTLPAVLLPFDPPVIFVASLQHILHAIALPAGVRNTRAVVRNRNLPAIIRGNSYYNMLAGAMPQGIVNGFL